MQRTSIREKRTITAMIRIYCRECHHQETLCEECCNLLEYTIHRIDRCIYGNDKPACKDCHVHCYSPKMKDKVKEIMRFSGPKMIYRHPVMALIHMITLIPRQGLYKKSIIQEELQIPLSDDN